jgi:hypothetical protein
VTSKFRLVFLLALAGTVALGLHCGDDKGPGPQPQLVIIPDSVSIEISSSETFKVDYDGDSPDVRWYVNGVPGGDPWIGMITTEGLYVAPDSLPETFGFVSPSVTLRAVAMEDATVEGTTRIFITREDTTAFVKVTPDTATIVITDSLEFTSVVSGCATEDVVWSVAAVTGDPDIVGTISSEGVYVAPTAAQSPLELMVRAVSVDCSDKSGVAKVVVIAGAASFEVELDRYTFSHNIEKPMKYDIAIAYCSHASEGKAVEGLDVEGEYIEVPITVPGPGVYTASVTYAAWVDMPLEVRVEVEGCSELSQSEDFLLDEGTGAG